MLKNWLFVIAMSKVIPAIATVRPRVNRTGNFERRLLEEVVAELAEETPFAVLRLAGSCGSGKSTALGHLAAVFAHDDRFQFLDDPGAEELYHRRRDRFVVVTMPAGSLQGLKLEPWWIDELLEYLLTKHRAACSSVIARLGAAAHQAWLPQLAAIVLDRFAADHEANDPMTELNLHVRQALAHPDQLSAVGQYCLAMVTAAGNGMDAAKAQTIAIACPDNVRSLLRHQIVQIPLAAGSIINAICNGSNIGLQQRLPFDLVESVGRLCQDDLITTKAIRTILNREDRAAEHPMASSILFAADANWQPICRQQKPWRFRGAYFSGAHWPQVILANADLSEADFSDADLAGANLSACKAYATRFDSAVLHGANLNHVEAGFACFRAATLAEAKLEHSNLAGSDFAEADLTGASLVASNLINADLTSAHLTGANLTGARLDGAVLDDADLTDAVLYSADLSAVDLRTTCLNGAVLEKANLKAAQMEDMVLPKVRLAEAVLRGAHLSGSKMPIADLRKVDLSGAYLAEINWEGVDLRDVNFSGATFHMGSSRSGLVGSPIACEGSKNGFYTDDFEDRNFKLPEEIRKANLRRCDLRGANIGGLDFYLVDLREAKLDPLQREHARKCGAILDDAIA
jgi:uncharacterized protein YjbI with pentapeptide repeats